MEGIEQVERRLWDAADQLRANSALTSTEYFMPVMGLIFLRHATNRFRAAEQAIQQNLPKRGGKPRPVKKADFTRRSALYLAEKARYDYLANLPGDRDIGRAIIDAMTAIEADHDFLKNVLPKDYHIFDDELLARMIKIFNDEALDRTNGDMFGRIYEYFLMKFAMQSAHDTGEFFTPVALVQAIVNVIEPDHGKVFDPACGSGGMFVQTDHFLKRYGVDTPRAVTF